MSYRDHLAHKMNILRTLLKSPQQSYHHAHGLRNVAQVGFVGFEHNQYSGYRVFEIMNDTGGERTLAEGMKVHECIKFIDGAIMALEGRLCMYGPANE